MPDLELSPVEVRVGGVTVVTVHSASVPLVAVRIFIPASSVASTGDAVAGTAALRITASRSDEVGLAPLGATFDAEWTTDGLLISVLSQTNALAESLRRAGSLLEGGISLEYARAGIAEAVTKRAEQERRCPARADHRLVELMFPDHPYGSEEPSTEDLLTCDPATLPARFAGCLARGALVVLVGEVEPENAENLVVPLTDLPAREPNAIPTLPTAAFGRVLEVCRGATQTSVRIGGVAPRRTEPTYAAASLATLILGGYSASRLWIELRERRGLAYTPQARLVGRPAGSVFVVSADVAQETAGAALEVIYSQLDGMRQSVPPSRELESARTHLLGALVQAASTHESLAESLLRSLINGASAGHRNEFMRSVGSASASEVAQAAEGLFDIEALLELLVTRAL